MALHGNLIDFKVVDIIQLINVQRKTGRLSIQSSSDSISLYFDEGELLLAHSELREERYNLFEYLVHHNIIDETRANDIREASKHSDLSPQDIFLMEGTITQRDIGSFNRFRAQELVLETLTWEQGIFRFEADIHPEKKNGLDMPLPVQSLLLEGMRCIDELDQLRKQFPKGAFRILQEPSVENPDLDSEAKTIWNLLKEERFLDELLSSSSVGHLRTMQILTEFAQKNMITTIQSKRSNAQLQFDPVLILPVSELTKICEELVRLISRAVIGTSLYPANHPQLQSTFHTIFSFVNNLLSKRPRFTVSHFENRLLAENQPLPYPHDQFSSFIEILRKRDIRSVTFYPGPDLQKDIALAIRILAGKVQDIQQYGGIKGYLLSQKVKCVTILPIESVDNTPSVEINLDHKAMTWGQLFSSMSLSDQALDLIRDDPARVAEMLTSLAGMNESLSLPEKDLQDELLHTSLQQLATIMSQMDDKTGSPDEHRTSCQLLERIIMQLPVDLRRSVMLAGVTQNALLDEAIFHVWEQMTLENMVELFVSEFETNNQKVDQKNPRLHSDFLKRMKENFQNSMLILDKLHNAEEKLQYQRDIRNRLFESGIPLKFIDFVIGKDQAHNSKLLLLLKRISESQEYDLFSSEVLDETKLLLHELAVEGDNASVTMLLQPYTQSMEADSWEIRQSAAETLREISDELISDNKYELLEEIVTKLIGRLNIEDTQRVFISLVHTAEKLCYNLRNTKGDTYTHQISKSLARQFERVEERDIEERTFLARALGHIGDPVAIQTLLRSLEDRSLNQECTTSLLKIGNAIIDPLLELLKTSDKQAVRYRVMQLLVEIGTDAVPAILQEFDNRIWYVRRNACMLIRKICGPEMLSRVAPLIKDEHPQVRREAIIAMGKFGGELAETILIDSLQDPDISLRRLAVFYLGDIGGVRAAKKLTELLDKGASFFPADNELLLEACNALGKLRATDAVPAISKIAKPFFILPWGKRKQLIYQAIQSLGRIGGREAKITLQYLAKSKNTQIQERAKASLSEIYRAETI